jgi:hypothetical protein
MQHAGDLARSWVEVGEQKAGLARAAVNGRGATVVGQADRLVPPIGETAGPKIVQGFQERQQFESFRAGRPGGDATQEGLDGEEPVEPPGRLAVEGAVADDAPSTSAGQRPFQRQILQVRRTVSPLLVAPFGRHHEVGKILRGEHRGGGVVEDDQAVGADPLPGPFHQIQQLIDVPMAQGAGAALCLVQRIAAEQGDIPVVIHPVERVVLENPVDRELQEIQPA